MDSCLPRPQKISCHHRILWEKTEQPKKNQTISILQELQELPGGIVCEPNIRCLGEIAELLLKFGKHKSSESSFFPHLCLPCGGTRFKRKCYVWRHLEAEDEKDDEKYRGSVSAPMTLLFYISWWSLFQTWPLNPSSWIGHHTWPLKSHAQEMAGNSKSK